MWMESPAIKECRASWNPVELISNMEKPVMGQIRKQAVGNVNLTLLKEKIEKKIIKKNS